MIVKISFYSNYVLDKVEKKKLKQEYLKGLSKSDSNKRNCYCSKEEVGTIEFCGTCMVCKKPGHTRHHPGAVPITGGWCDYHYIRLSWTHPTAKPGMFVWLASIGLICFVIKSFF